MLPTVTVRAHAPRVDEGNPVPYRTKAILESWLEEFRELGYPASAGLKVLTQDGADGADTGLVTVVLENASTEMYFQPTAQGGSKWAVTFEPRDEVVVLAAPEVLKLSTELATVSALCAFLEAKSLTFLAELQH